MFYRRCSPNWELAKIISSHIEMQKLVLVKPVTNEKKKKILDRCD